MVYHCILVTVLIPLVLAEEGTVTINSLYSLFIIVYSLIGQQITRPWYRRDYL